MAEPITMANIKRLFMALHGMYGNVVIDKYKTGEVDANGLDRGIASTQAMWLNGLGQFDAETVKAAIPRCADRHKTFPPTLPEFRDLCLAARPRYVATNTPRIGISDEMRSKAAEASRKAIADIKAKRAGEGRFETGVLGIVAMAAHAHGQAGGDEAAMLRLLESQYVVIR